MATLLTDQQVNDQLKSVPEWLYDNERAHLYTGIEFQDFDRAIDFVNTIRDLANSINHFPDIYISNFKFVQLFLRTPAAEGVTDTDFQFALAVDQLFAQSEQLQAPPAPAPPAIQPQQPLPVPAVQIVPVVQQPTQITQPVAPPQPEQTQSIPVVVPIQPQSAPVPTQQPIEAPTQQPIEVPLTEEPSPIPTPPPTATPGTRPVLPPS